MTFSPEAMVTKITRGGFCWTSGRDTGMRESVVLLEDISVGYSSSSFTRLYFGLGWGPVVKSLEIRWPGGVTQRINEVTVNRAIQIVEAN